MAEHRAWVRDLQAGTEVEESYAVRSCDVRQRRGGGGYLALTLGDKTGHVAALAWENVDRLRKTCRVGGVVRVRGQVQRYNQRLQLVIRDAVAIDEDEIREEHFIRSSNLNPAELWRRLHELLEGVEDVALRQLLFRVFSDPEVEGLFRRAPAARSMHHAFKAGLLEHTVSMATSVRLLAGHYGVDASLVVAGALLHDLGKIWELELGPSIEYTDDGRLLGHLPMEVLFVDRKISEMSTFPAETRRQLLHVLLSHHGEYEHGSPRRPKMPEALLVHAMDNLDSKMGAMLQLIEEGGETGDAWTPYSPILGRHIYRRRPGGDGEE